MVVFKKTRLYLRIITLARRVNAIINELTGVQGELADIAESYEAERRLCARCGSPLDAELRCPVCCARADEEEL